MKKKLGLNKLQVSSFVTALSKNNEQTIKGGTSAPCTSSVACMEASAAVVGVVVAASAIAYEVANNQSWALCSPDEGPDVIIINKNKKDKKKDKE